MFKNALLPVVLGILTIVLAYWGGGGTSDYPSLERSIRVILTGGAALSIGMVLLLRYFVWRKYNRRFSIYICTVLGCTIVAAFFCLGM